jgi:hypothetical protein
LVHLNGDGMPSSGTYNFSLSNGEAVLDAFERIGLRMPQLEQEHFFTARRHLSLLLDVEWSNRQVNLWTVTLNSVPLVQGTATYVLPANVVMILDAYRSTTTGTTQTDIFMWPISRDDYATYPNKGTQAPPTTYWFNRQITPQVTLWPVPDAGGPYTLNYYCCTQVQDANVPSGETPNLPTRWLDAMCAGLAHRLARIYKPELEAVRKADYETAWGFASQQDIENVPVRIAPRMEGYWR